LFIIGPPGCKRKEISLTLAESLQEERKFEGISVGELLKREVIKKSDFGKQIVESRKTYSYVKDEIVINIVKHNIE
jgi:adenylate kinase family enzyme